MNKVGTLRSLSDAELHSVIGGSIRDYVLTGPGGVVLGASAVAGIYAALALGTPIRNGIRAALGGGD